MVVVEDDDDDKEEDVGIVVIGNFVIVVLGTVNSTGSSKSINISLGMVTYMI